ncbi:hypothetical protein CLOM_g23964 [Closterium sp. NIES-68]|nr:hypothetical protein CLOM_g23964 [Closterium sp. NIES-68]
MAAVKLRNAEVQASGSPTKVMSSAYARQRTSGWAAAVVWSAGWMAAAKRRGPMGSPWRTPRALSRDPTLDGGWMFGEEKEGCQKGEREKLTDLGVSASVDSAAAVDIVGGAVSALMLLGDYVRALLEEAGADEAV